MKELLNSKDIMEEFDQEIFNALVDYVIIGGYDENGMKDQYLIRFILKREFDLSIPKEIPNKVIVKNNKHSLKYAKPYKIILKKLDEYIENTVVK